MLGNNEIGNLQINKGPVELNKDQGIFKNPTFDTSKLSEYFSEDQIKGLQKVNEKYNNMKDDPLKKQEMQKKVQEAPDNRTQRTRQLSALLAKGAGNKSLQQRRVRHLPGQNILFTDFGRTFKESISASKRAGKIRNRKSRLHFKDVNYNAILEASNNMSRRKFNVMSRAMENRSIGCDQQTFHDLSAFMILSGPNDTMINKTLLDNYIGTGRDEQTGAVIGQDRTAALDSIVQMVFSIDVSDVNFESDTEMVKSANKLENLVNCVGAFDRIMSKNGSYFEGITPELKRGIEKRLEELRAVANYYVSRKELLSDENFRTHYDYELSMEVNENSTPEQRATAEKIMNSYILAKNLMRINDGRPYNPDNFMMRFGNRRSQELYNQTLEITNTELQKEYLQKAYTSMDYLAGGIRLNANKLDLSGGSDTNLDYYIGLDHTLDAKVQRSDIDRIREKLAAKGLRIGLGDNELTLKNPYTGISHQGLGLGRILKGFTKRATASWGTDDIVDMLYNLFAPCLPQNQNLDQGTDEERQRNLPKIQTLNENFRRAFASFKSINSNYLKSYMNTFGNLPQQLTAEDNKKLLRKYGDLIKEFSLANQNVYQMFDGDKAGTYFSLQKGSGDMEFLYRHAYCNLSTYAFSQAGAALQLDEGEQAQDEAAILNIIPMSVQENPVLMTAGFEKNEYIQGPTMSERQMKAYMARKKKVMPPAEYEAFANRRKNLTQTVPQILKLWEREKITAYAGQIGQGTILDNMNAKKNVLMHLRTLDHLKTLPAWNNPEKERNAETRKKIILAKENENYLKNVKKALDLAIAYKSLLETKQKELQKNNDQTDVNTLPEVVAAKREMDLCRESLQYCDSVTVVEARENSLREVQRPADEDYSQQAYDNALRDFKNLKIKDVKFGSYEEMIHNYQRNMDMCMKAMRFQNLLGEALLLGHEYKDKFLMECRAKIRFFAAIRQTLVRVNKFYADNADTGNAEQYRNRLEDGIRGGAQDYNITAMPTNDIKALYNRFYEQVKNDHDNREDHIEAVCHIMSNINYEVIQGEDGEEVRWPEVPAAEMRRRKKDYQKNAAIADFLKHQNDDYIASTNEAEAAVRTYLRRNGIFLSSPLDRTVGVYLSQMKPAEAIAAIRKYTGSNEDKVKFYLDMKREIDSVPVEEFSLQDLAGAFKGSTLRKRFKVAMLGQNAQDIGTRIAALMDAQKDPQPLPEEFESREDMLAKTKFTQDFFNTYVGRITSLCQRGNSQFAGAIDLYDYERLDPFLVEKKLNQPVISQDITEMLYMNDIAFRARTVVPQFNYKGEIDLNDYLNGIKPNLVLLSSDMKSAYREEYKAKFGQYPPVNMQQNNQ